MIWACHFFTTDVNQMLRKPFKFSAMQLTFGRQHVLMPLNRQFHLDITGSCTLMLLDYGMMEYLLGLLLATD
jgi:hypothetical protein